MTPMPAVVANAVRTATVEERFDFTRARVDRSDPEHPKVIGVVICGRESANRRRYKDELFADDAKLKVYEGRHNFIDHGKPNEPRSYLNRISTTENVRRNENRRPVADLAVNPKHPYAEMFLWDVENKPNSFGMSHKAAVKYRVMPDGWEEVEDIVSVESVDVVTDPATTKGMFTESKGHPTMTTLKEWLPAFLKRPEANTALCLKAKRVQEEMADAPMDEGGGVPEAIKAACAAVIDECMAGGKESLGSCMKKLRKILGIHHDMNDMEAEPEESDEPEEPAEEARKPDPWVVLEECQKQGYTPTPTELKALAALTSADERKAYVTEQRAKVPAATPRSAERKPGGSTVAPAAPPAGAPVVTEQRAFPAWN